MDTDRNVARRAAFTLVELLVVMGIVALLAAILTPAIIGAMNKARETSTLSRIHQCEIAAQAFFNDFGDYPPMHWDELDEFFKYDSNGPGGVPDGIYDRDGSATGFADEVFFVGGLNDATNPSTVNEGIEVFAACLATRSGGPYLEAEGDWLRNVDGPGLVGDTDAANHVANATNWYVASNTTNDPIFELVDWWGNPLVYVHNRNYSDYDGDNGAGGWDLLGEGLLYADVEGTRVNCYARGYWSTRTNNYPNLNGFQLYSWGRDGFPGCAEDPNNPGTPLEPEAGYWPGWTRASGNLTNWEE